MVDAVILGMDALDPRWIKYWLMKGQMPRLKSEHQAGRAALKDIDSVKAPGHRRPVTNVAWPSVYTGLQPTEHGVTDSPVKMRKFNFAEQLDDTLFDDLSADRRVGSFRMPMTWPARPVNGWMISGYPAGGRDGTAATPREVYGLDPDDLPDDFHRLEETKMSNAKDTDNPKSIHRLVTKDERGLDIVADLLDEHGDVDVLCFGTQSPDHLGHLYFKAVKNDLGKDLDDIPDSEKDFATSRYASAAYSAVDTVFGAVIDRFDPEYVWAIGDHGFLRHDSGHSMHTAFIEWHRDGGVSTSEMGKITDFRQLVRDRLNTPWAREAYEGETDTEITAEELEQVEDKLEDLGYM